MRDQVCDALGPIRKKYSMFFLDAGVQVADVDGLDLFAR